MNRLLVKDISLGFTSISTSALMPLTIIPSPIRHDGELRVNANEETGHSQGSERDADTQNDWNVTGGICKIWLDTRRRDTAWYGLQHGRRKTFNELRINSAVDRHDCDERTIMARLEQFCKGKKKAATSRLDL